MENPATGKSVFDLSFDENLKQQLKGAAKWGGFAAIISITGSVLTVITYFIQKNNPGAYKVQGFPDMQTQNAANLFSVIITFILGLILFYFLNKFSRAARNGIDGNDQLQINEGLGSLSTYFRIISILLIIGIVFLALGLLIGVGTRT